MAEAPGAAPTPEKAAAIAMTVASPAVLWSGKALACNQAKRSQWMDADVVLHSNGCITVKDDVAKVVERIGRHGGYVKAMFGKDGKVMDTNHPMPAGNVAFKIEKMFYFAVSGEEWETVNRHVKALTEKGILNEETAGIDPDRKLLPEDALYADDCVTVYDDRIVVTWYYMPLGNIFELAIGEMVKAGAPEEFGVDMSQASTWGLAREMQVWWAADRQRNKPGHNLEPVIVDFGAWPRAGFSVRDRAAFLGALDEAFRAKE
eukprot:gene16965-22537_t